MYDHFNHVQLVMVFNSKTTQQTVCPVWPPNWNCLTGTSSMTRNKEELVNCLINSAVVQLQEVTQHIPPGSISLAKFSIYNSFLPHASSGERLMASYVPLSISNLYLFCNRGDDSRSNMSPVYKNGGYICTYMYAYKMEMGNKLLLYLYSSTSPTQTTGCQCAHAPIDTLYEFHVTEYS